MDKTSNIHKQRSTMKTIITLICLFFFSLGVNAQVKIGNITVTESTAKEYFLFCYQNPDTSRWFYEYTVTKDMKEKEKRFYESLDKARSYVDSMAVFQFDSSTSCFSRMANEEENYFLEHSIGRVTTSIERNGDTFYYIGYLTKHEPTAQDFLEWYIKQGK